MFTQKISMDCTKEQYKKYLKDELLKMGYKEAEVDGSYWEDYFVIVNNFGELGQVTQLTNANKNAHDHTYLGKFNAPLFLALAAMTDKAEGNYGELFIGLLSENWYSVVGSDKPHFNYKKVRKATKEEIMAKFGNNSISKQPEKILEDFYQIPFISMLHFGIDLAAKGSSDKSVKVTMQRNEQGDLILTGICNLGPFSRDEEDELKISLKK